MSVLCKGVAYGVIHALLTSCARCCLEIIFTKSFSNEELTPTNLKMLQRYCVHENGMHGDVWSWPWPTWRPNND